METALPYQRIAERIEPPAQPGGFLTEKLLFFVVFRHLAERRGVTAEYLREFLMEPQLLFGKAAGIPALFFRRMSESLSLFPLRDIRREAFRNILRCFGPVPVQYLTERPAGVGALARAGNRQDSKRRKRKKRCSRSQPENTAIESRGGKGAGGEQEKYPCPKPESGRVGRPLRFFRPAHVGAGALGRRVVRFRAAEDPGAKRRFCRGGRLFAARGLIFRLFPFGPAEL